MKNPASPPTVRRTCPACNRQVMPDYKFCESCGTPVPELSACSICGTHFTTPVNYCDVCGSPVNPGVEPETDGPAERPRKTTGPVEEQSPKRDEEEFPEPEMEELPDDREKRAAPEVVPPPHHHGDEDEPDTDQLLELYGSEYRADETLESHRKEKPKDFDDPLFFSQLKTNAPSASQMNWPRVLGGCFVLIVIIAAVFFIGLPMLPGNGDNSTHSNQITAEITPFPDPTTVSTIPPATSTPNSTIPRALIPQPTQLMPSGSKLYFQVGKNPVTSKISVVFAGSAGQGSINSADIRVTHPDGSVATGVILPLKGATEITVDGSNKTDRVEIIAHMSAGESYRVYDELVPS